MRNKECLRSPITLNYIMVSHFSLFQKGRLPILNLCVIIRDLMISLFKFFNVVMCMNVLNECLLLFLLNLFVYAVFSGKF